MDLENAQAQVFEKKQMQLPKKGQRVAVLSGIVDTGIHVRQFKGKDKPPQREFVPFFTLVNDTYTVEKEGEDPVTRNHVVRPFPLKLLPGAENAKYFDFYNALDPNHEVLDKDGAGNVYNLIGKPCFVKVEYSKPDKDDLVYPNVAGYSELPEDYPAEVNVDYETLIFKTSKPEKDVFMSLNSYLQNEIRTSEGYAGSELEAALEGEGAAGSVEEESADEDSPDTDEESPI